MPDYSKNIVYLSKEQYQTLITNQSVTANGQTITYNENDIYVTPQAEPITDVKINNVSIGSNGVASIPVATNSDLGLVKGGGSKGIIVASDPQGSLAIYAATEMNIKLGTDSYKPIVSGHVQDAAFYGLSKAAGADLASASNITVGTYPATSKGAIQNMLGISDLLAPTESSLVASKAYAVGDVFTANGKLYKVTAAITSGESIVVQDKGETVSEHKAEEVTVGEDFVKKTDIATSSTLGLISIGNGLNINQNGAISINKAIDQNIQAGTHQYLPIVPEKQHIATFYGLSKAAGVDLASETVTVGTYPAAAKTAIRAMLGATSSNVIEVSDTQPTDTDNKIWMPETAPAGIEVPTYAEFQAGLAGKVSDVKIGTSSIVTNGVATIPMASSSTAGVIKVLSSYGFQINNAGCIASVSATEGDIRNGSSNFRFIVPSNQSQAVFFGLASAAGDNTQSASENAVGTYTSEAKAAIQSMLGINYTLTVTVLTQDNVTVTEQTVTVREGGSEGQIYATATYSGQPVSFALPTGFSYYVSVSDTLAHHFNPTTASGIITNTDVAATLTYSDFSTIQTAADIKAALNAGLDLTDLVGEQVSCIWNGSTLVWDIVDYNNNTITLLTHDTLPTQLQFEPQQALMWCENGLAAGSYCFTHSSSTYYFTLTTAIPAEGQLRATTSAFQTYASMEATSTLETGTVSTTEISGATSLGTTASGNLNHMDRVNYGSNNYKESGLFQWLNSTAAANTPMPRITKFSRPYSVNVPGFLGALDSSFVAAIDDTTWFCSTNNTYECPSNLGGTVAKQNAYTVTAKIGLASEMEIFGSYGGTADGSTIYDLYSGADADDRKKYQPGTSTARYWWLRSPSWSYADRERYVNTSGTAFSSSAYNSYGVVPAVRISKDVSSS